jgi:dihydropteroate synthase
LAPVHPLVMGIVNVTPDSFSDGGRFIDAAAAIEHGRSLLEQGADIVDVGGESSRPGADPVSADEELARVLPVIEALAGDVRVSIDTTKAAVAEAAIDAGASLVNDITATLHEVAADRGVGWIAMHMQGEPRTMQVDPRYRDVVAEVIEFLVARARVASAAGVAEVWIDPGIGFGKTAAHNWALLAAVDRLAETGWPVAVGTSRKSFLATPLARADGGAPSIVADDRLEGSVATATWAASLGAGMVRVHDVAATVGALRAVAA